MDFSGRTRTLTPVDRDTAALRDLSRHLPGPRSVLSGVVRSSDEISTDAGYRSPKKSRRPERHPVSRPFSRVCVLGHRALPCLSGTYAVVEMNDAASKPALIQEFELCTDVARQCVLAATHEHRNDEQTALVDQPRGYRLTG